MKKRAFINSILVIILSILSIACASKKSGDSKETQIAVTLNVTLTSNYCGGAAPSDDMISKLKEPKIFNGSFFISTKESLQEDMKSLKTSTDGSINIDLVKETYFVFLPEKTTAKHSGKGRSEENCNKWKNTPNGSFTVTEDKSITFNIHKTCDKCGSRRM
jgi:predicted component of type VI protein secretion system